MSFLLPPASLILDNGLVFHGKYIGEEKTAWGEVVFNTGMTGYQEVLTDPSYQGQIVTFVSSHIGNTGINVLDSESQKIQVAAIVTRDIPAQFSNWRAKKSLKQFLAEQKIVGMTDIDTRRLASVIRQYGTAYAAIVNGCVSIEEALLLIKQKKIVSAKKYFNQHKPFSAKNKPLCSLVVYDFGIKESILNIFLDLNCKLTIVSPDTSAQEVINLSPDGIVLSNGPGNPIDYSESIQHIKTLSATHIPMLGICLGHQLISLANGANIVKMSYGHHGINHPVKNVATEKISITSQNHNFVIDDDSLPSNMMITHRSAFDHTIQGVTYADNNIMSFQGHPEGHPGPTDIKNEIFGSFINLVLKNRKIIYAD